MGTLKQEVDLIAYNLNRTGDFEAEQAIKISILDYLGKFLREDYTKTAMYRNSLLVTLKCVDVEKVPSTDCCSIDLGCKILKTSIKIPRPIDLKEKFDFEYVGSVDSTTPFSYIQPSEIGYFKYRKFLNTHILYTYTDGYIYLFNNLSVKKVTVRYLPENPIDLDGLSCDANCFDINNDIAIPSDLAPVIRQFIYNEFKMPNRSEEIQINDAK